MRNGYETLVITEQLGADLPLRETRDGITVLRLKSAEERTLAVQLRVALGLTRRLIACRRTSTFAIVRSFTLPALVVGLLKHLKLLPYPTIVLADTGGHEDDIVALGRRRFPRLSRWLVSGNDVLAGICRANVEHLYENGFPPNKIAFVPNGIDITPLQYTEAPVSVKRFLFLGRLDREKGIYELLEAMSMLVDKKADVHLSFAGDGPEATTLVSEISDAGLQEHVTLLGRVDHEDLNEVFSTHDCLVLPSYSEGCPLSVLEAAAHRRALVLTEVGDLREYFDGHAHFCEARDVDSLAKAMSEATKVEYPQDHLDYVKVMQGVSIETIAGRIVELLLGSGPALSPTQDKRAMFRRN